jgi:adenylate kinase family enzyme
MPLIVLLIFRCRNWNLVKRLDARAKTNERMPYDTSAATIVARLEEHAQRNDSIVNYYSNTARFLVDVDGHGNKDVVYERIKDHVQRAIRNLR